MLIRSRIPLPRNERLLAMLAPVLSLVRQVTRLFHDTLSALTSDERDGPDYSATTKLAAFGAFLAFSLAAYHVSALGDAIVLALFVAWAADCYLVAHRAGATHYREITLEVEGSVARWRSSGDPSGEGEVAGDFELSDISGVSVERCTRAEGAFRTLDSHPWRVFVVTGERWLLLYEEDDTEVTLRKAENLASSLGVSLAVSRSEGVGSWAAQRSSHSRELWSPHYRDPERRRTVGTVWTVNRTSGSVVIHKPFSRVGAMRAARNVLEETGVLLFVVMVVGLMSWVGLVFTLLLENGFGLDVTSRLGQLDTLDPKQILLSRVDGIFGLQCAFAVGALLVSAWDHLQRQTVTLDGSVLKYLRAGTLRGQVTSGDIEQILLLRDPKPALVVVASGGTVLEVERLEAVQEYEDLYGILVTELGELRS